uniref:Mitochondrial GTPase 1 n=1 Tax=Hirondellea gigas TaxID=1518452 RepID=A0A6A7FN93_9CRUS
MAATARTIIRHGLEMRQHFYSEKLKMENWFPRHMYRGLLQVQGKLHSIDAVVEVHDARIPFTGRNNKLTDIGIVKPSVLVINKIDLIDPRYRESLQQRFERMGHTVLFSNCKDSGDAGVKNLIPCVIDKLSEDNRFNRAGNPVYNLMVIGVPNVGKSSLINCLRSHNVQRKKCATVGPVPGVTRSVMERIKVYRKPEVFVRDTPGVLAPRIPDIESGIKLALTAVVDDRLIGTMIMADYLLYWLNRRGRHEYVTKLQLSGPTDHIQKLLVTIALKNNLIRQSKSVKRDGKKFPDMDEAAMFFVRLWRKGELGCAMLDDEELILP